MQFIIPVNNVEGDIETVSVRHSICLSDKRKSSHSHNFSPILTKFLQHVYINEKFICSFIKKVAKIVAMATIFFLSFDASYLPIFLPYIRAWR